ncbi:MAG: LLM class flavin-dependent oxidoreductase [Salinarimonadaceae bacterium]|nr:MAG: LLM class flavin-dependent oxidoreductase [Salinarimonadaceae bacterium]
MTGRAETPIRVDLAGFAREGRLGDHAELMDLVTLADRLGYGCVWFNEFHFSRDGIPYPSTLLLGAEILARTERLRFGASVLVLPLHHPLLLAEQIAQLDRQSGGRVDIGVGRSTDPASFAALGLDPDEARPRFAEALRVMIAAWTMDMSSNDGPVWPFRNVAVGPPPVQYPHPPLYMAAVSADSIDAAAQLGFPLLYSLEPNEDRQAAPYREALARHGRGPEPLHRSSLSRYVLVAARREAALAQLDDLTQSLNAARARRAAARGAAPPAPRDRAEMLAGYAIAGDPDDCIEQIRALCARHMSRSLRALFSANGLIPMPQAREAMRLFSAQVLPELTVLTPEMELIS